MRRHQSDEVFIHDDPVGAVMGPPVEPIRVFAGVGVLDEPEEGPFQVRGSGQTVQHDAVSRGDLPDLLGCRVDDEPVVAVPVSVACGVERGSEPTHLGGAHPGSDAGLGAELGECRGSEQSAARHHEDMVGSHLHLAECVA